MRHINEPPPPIRDKRPDVPPRVEAAVQRAMAKSPSDRFASMAALCAELDACMAELSSESHAVPAPAQIHAPRRCPSPWPIVLALLVLIAFGAGIAYWALHRQGGGPSGVPSVTSGVGSLVHLTGV